MRQVHADWIEGIEWPGDADQRGAAGQQGVAPAKLRGTIQNDMLKEFIAQKEWISPVRPSMRIIRDMLVWCTKEMPLWNTISISGYHIREAGATAVQERLPVVLIVVNDGSLTLIGDVERMSLLREEVVIKLLQTTTNTISDALK